jgi:hypothetical protein
MNIFEKRTNILNLLGIALCLGSVAVFVTALVVHNDFWVDEATLVQTVLTRGFGEIAATPPDFSQNAPLGYLYVLKLFSLVLGKSTFSLRLPAVLAALGLMFVAYKTAKDLLDSKCPFLYAGASVLSSTFLDYATQAKQYSFEALGVLVCVYVMGLYCKGKTRTLKPALIYALVIWFSFTSALFAFGCIVVMAVDLLIKTIKKKIPVSEFIKTCLPFFIPLASVLVNLVLWVLPCSAGLAEGAALYWNKLRFPLLPTSISDIKLLYLMAKNIIQPFGFGIIALGVCAVFLLFMLDKKGRVIFLNKPMLGIYVALGASFVASNLGYLPVISRLFIFVYPLTLIGVAYIAEYLSDNISELFKNKALQKFVVIMICLMCAADFGLLALIKRYIKPGQQLSASVDYVTKHREENDYIYVCSSALPLYLYLTDYAAPYKYFSTDNETSGKIIYGAYFWNSVGEKPYEYKSVIYEKRFNREVETISAHKTVWLLFSHTVPTDGSPPYLLLEALKKYGAVTLENEYYGTPLYKFEKE